MSHTVSPEQLAANRANAARSTGPRTLQGKTRSSQNARKHGFTACLNESLDPTTGDPIVLINEVLAGDIEISKAQNRNYLLGDGFHRCARQSNSFALLLRYQAQAERQYRRAIEEFERLKALREELRNEIHMTGMLATPGNENSPLQRYCALNDLRVFSEEPNSPRKPRPRTGPSRGPWPPGPRPPARGVFR